jgi:hypothetical protein
MRWTCAEPQTFAHLCVAPFLGGGGASEVHKSVRETCEMEVSVDGYNKMQRCTRMHGRDADFLQYSASLMHCETHMRGSVCFRP